LMGGGGQGHALSTEKTDQLTVETQTSFLVGTILASILWQVTFGEDASKLDSQEGETDGVGLCVGQSTTE